MYAVRCWITLTIGGGLLAAVIVGCSRSSPPSESSAPPPEKPVPTMPAPLAEPSSPAPPPRPAPRKFAKTAPQGERDIAPARDRNATAAPQASPPLIEEPVTETRPERAVPDDSILLYREEAAAKELAPESNTVVKVYYATDRSTQDVDQWQRMRQGGWPKLTGVCVAVTALLIFWRPRRGSVAVRSLAWFMLMATVAVGGLTLGYYWLPESADLPIERMYGNDRGKLELGICEVSIPKDHQTGELESPSVLRLEFRQDPERHVMLIGVHSESPSSFYTDLRQCVDRSSRKEAFVFIHGYSVGFETAVRRTAQIAYDLKFEGAPIVYSWPSQGGLFSYTVDETNVVWTVPHLKEFLVNLAQQSGATSIHLIAHSMGNRALTSALRELVMDRDSQCPRFHEVILTAPDIDAEIFRRDLAPAIVQSADRVTLYASSNDEALVASHTVHGYLRAGESGDNVVVVPGIDTVDVSEVDTSLIGHSYYGSNTTVLADLFELMQGSKSPDQRRWLQSMRLGALKYWKFLKEKFHGAT